MIDDSIFKKLSEVPNILYSWVSAGRPNLIVSHSVQADTEAKQKTEKVRMKREWDETWWIEACPRNADGETFPMSCLGFFITPSSQNGNKSQQGQHLLTFYSCSALKLTVWYTALCADVGSVRAGKIDMSLIGIRKKWGKSSKTEHGDDMKHLNI